MRAGEAVLAHYEGFNEGWWAGFTRGSLTTAAVLAVLFVSYFIRPADEVWLSPPGPPRETMVRWKRDSTL